MFNILFGTVVVLGLIASITLCAFVVLLAYIGRGEAP